MITDLPSLLSLASTPEGLQQLRVMVALIEGYQKHPVFDLWYIDGFHGFNPKTTHIEPLPEYSTSLDAMAALLKDKGPAFMSRYALHLTDTYRADWERLSHDQQQEQSCGDFSAYIYDFALKPDTWRWVVAFILASQKVPA